MLRDDEADSPNPMGFEPMINQRLLPPTFPRYTRIKPRVEALQYFDELVHRLRHAWKITSCTNFHIALDFFMEFSRRACILSRSALQLLYLSPSPANTATMALSAGGNTSSRPQQAFIEILREAIKAFAREFVDNFLARCVRPFAVLLQVTGHNRARQRDKLALLLDEFASLQEEAESVDAVISGAAGVGPRAWLGTWVLYHVLRVMMMMKALIVDAVISGAAGVGPRAWLGTWVLYHVLRSESVDAVISGAAGVGPRAWLGTWVLYHVLRAESVDAVISGAAGVGPRAWLGTWVLYHVLRAESVDAVISGAAGVGPRAWLGTWVLYHVLRAESVDAVISGAAGVGPRAWLGTWVLYHVLRVMIAYLLSGLELELYS
ncbi:N-alpha-acetyltransferase 35, partial [Operophtera brumata]